MARTQRLLDLIQNLRARRYAVTAETLAHDLGVSVRTVYRDIADLQAQGAPIEGAAGVGYLLRPGFTLPPLMFTLEELEALVLGMAWVGRRPDPPLAQAALHLKAKIQAVLPTALARELETTTLLVGGTRHRQIGDPERPRAFRRAIREGRKVLIEYSDQASVPTARTIWPFGLGYFEEVLIVLAWCELRQDLRHFRMDRILTWKVLSDPMPESRHELLARWRVREGVPES